MSKQAKVMELLKKKREILLNGEPNNAICYDGIVNEEQYADVVVLLKETNGNEFFQDSIRKNWVYAKLLSLAHHSK